MYSITAVEKIISDVCKKAGTALTVPVTVNGRLTRTLGRVLSDSADGGKTWNPAKIEFSKQLLETASEESIKQIILHETAHYIVEMRTHEDHGHDEYFKAVCAEIGCTADKTKAKVDRVKAIQYKYDVRCKNCGGVWHYNRAGKVIQNIGYYSCGECGGELEYQQNF